MSNGDSDLGPRGKQFGPGEGPQLLAHLQATGAEVVGSDGEKIGDLKSVGDADFQVGRTIRSDLHVPIARIKEVTEDNRIVLDIPADKIGETDWDEREADVSEAGDFSASPVEEGIWEVAKRKARGSGGSTDS
jgi:hypothetical protein